MSSAKEKAAARRAKILARAAGGNNDVKWVAEDGVVDNPTIGVSSPASAGASAHDKVASRIDKIAARNGGSDGGVGDNETENEKFSTPAKEVGDSEETTKTPKTPAFLSNVDSVKKEPASTASEKAVDPEETEGGIDLDTILHEAAEEVAKEQSEKEAASTPTSEAKSSRPLADRRRKILAKKALAKKLEAAGGEGGEGEEGEEGEKQYEFISKSAKQVEEEIAALTKKNNDDILGVDESKRGNDNETPKKDEKTGEVKVGSLREKLLKKKADRKKKDESGETDTPDSGNNPQSAIKAKKVEKLQKLAEGKASDPNASTNLVKMLIMLFLGCFAGYRSYNNNRLDMVQALTQRQKYLDSVSNSSSSSSSRSKAASSSSSSSSSRSQSQADLDKLFDLESEDSEESGKNGKSGYGFHMIGDALKPVTVPAKMYMEQMCLAMGGTGHMGSEKSEVLVEGIFRNTYHNPNLDGQTFTVNDEFSMEGCSNSMFDLDRSGNAGITSYLIGMAVLHILKFVGILKEKKSADSGFSLSYLNELYTEGPNWIMEYVYGMVGETALYVLALTATASFLAYYDYMSMSADTTDFGVRAEL